MTDWSLPKRARADEVPWPRAVGTPAEAVRFINHVGFCVLFPVKNVPLPSLYYAASKRLPARWDQYAHKIWGWRDRLPEKRRAFYAKYFKARATFISLEFLPSFVAMRGAVAKAQEAERFYDAGRITRDARTLWDTLAREGPLPTLELRYAAKFDSPPGNVRFKKAILELQCQLIVAHTGGEQETESWASNRFDLLSRAFPAELARARNLPAEEARRAVARRYLKHFPSALPARVSRLFSWSKAETLAAIAGPGSE